MKRFGIIFLSLVINTFVLIHVVVPHHHHENIPCFHDHVSQCEDLCHHDSEDDAKNHGCSSHKQSDSEKSTCCFFEQVLVLNSQDEKNEHECSVCLHHHTNHLVQAVLLAINYDFFIPPKENYTEKPPYLLSLYSIEINRVFGLRAPPVA